MESSELQLQQNWSTEINGTDPKEIWFENQYHKIETQWHQIKIHEIAGQIFDNEYDLAMTVIQGIKNRSEIGNYQLERFIFNSTQLLIVSSI